MVCVCVLTRPGPLEEMERFHTGQAHSHTGRSFTICYIVAEGSVQMGECCSLSLTEVVYASRPLLSFIQYSAAACKVLPPEHDFQTGMLIENSTVRLLPAFSTASHTHTHILSNLPHTLYDCML